MKKLTTAIISMLFLFQIVAMASGEKVLPESDGKALMEMEASGDYAMVMTMATDVEVNEEKTEIRFKNKNTRDTSTYIINSETVFGRLETETDRETLDINRFIDGSLPGIVFYVPLGKYHEYSLREGEVIPVSGILTFFKKAVGVQGNSEEETPEDKAHARHVFLRSFEIMVGDENGDLQPERLLTRAEMAQIAVNMLRLRGVEPNYPNMETFLDVEKSYWGYNAIHLMRGAGHVQGYGDGTFRPEGFVTNAEAIKMLVSILGYAPRAAECGGFPDGYLKVAEEIGLLKDLQLVPSALSTRQNVMDMIFNAVYLPVMEQTVYGAEPEYTVMDGQNGPLVRFYDKYLDR